MITSEAARWTIVGGLFVFGAVLGSFINVVAYRLPRGMSLVHPGSRCPACEKPIRWYDNVPIVGWLWLGGRCRDCRATISIRYPIVEALVGVASALVGWAVGVVAIAPPPGVELAFALEFGPYAFDLLLVCTLIAAALIEFDYHRPPVQMLLWILLAGLVLTALWPQLEPGAAPFDSTWKRLHDNALAPLAALVLGMLGWPAWVATAGRDNLLVGAIATLELLLVGVFLGAASVATIAVVAMGMYVVLRIVEELLTPWFARFGWAAALAVATLMEIVLRMSDSALEFAFLFGGSTGFALAGATMAILSCFARYVPSPARPPQRA